MIDSIKKNAGTLVVIIIAILFYKLLGSFDGVKAQLSKIIRILLPFLWAFAIAYLLNPLMTKLEKKLKIKRKLSLLLSFLVFIGFITMFIIIFSPVIVENIVDIIEKLPFYAKETEYMLNKHILSIPISNELNLINFINENMQSITTQILDLLNLTLQGLIGTILTFTSGIAKFALGIIISAYLLHDKEKFMKSIKKLIIGVTGPFKAGKILEFLSEINLIFYNFFVGKAIDSLIIGIICYIGLSIIQAPYAMLMSLIVGVFNMIPYFGPFIGAIPAVLFTFLTDPIKAIWVVVFIFALQQFDGIVLGPKILGDKMGISPFYIILAIMIGGGYFGMLGMLFGVPIFKVIDIVLTRALDKKIKEHNEQLKMLMNMDE